MYRFRRYGRKRYFKRTYRKNRYSSYRSKRWNKRRSINKVKRFRAAIAKVAETKYNSYSLTGHLAGNFAFTGVLNNGAYFLPNEPNPYAYITINPYNNAREIV